jgi:Phospholipase_D-nuclease N-terminal
MARFYLLVFALAVLLTVVALISCLSAQKPEVRGLPRFVWAILIILFPIAGAVVYFLVGRPVPAGGAQAWSPGAVNPSPQRAPRVLAPDDDPAFLSALDASARRDDEDLLKRWEEDLKKREDDLRKREDSPPSDG